MPARVPPTEVDTSSHELKAAKDNSAFLQRQLLLKSSSLPNFRSIVWILNDMLQCRASGKHEEEASVMSFCVCARAICIECRFSPCSAHDVFDGVSFATVVLRGRYRLGT